MSSQNSAPTRANTTVSRRQFNTRALTAAAVALAAPAISFADTQMTPTVLTFGEEAKLEALCNDIEVNANFHSKMHGHIQSTENRLDQRLPTALSHRALYRDKIRSMATELKPLQPQTLAQFEAKEQALQTARGFLALV